MKIVSSQDNIVTLRGYGFDQLGGDFSDYGIVVMIEHDEISRIQLNMYDRDLSIVYL